MWTDSAPAEYSINCSDQAHFSQTSKLISQRFMLRQPLLLTKSTPISPFHHLYSQPWIPQCFTHSNNHVFHRSVLHIPTMQWFKYCIPSFTQSSNPLLPASHNVSYLLLAITHLACPTFRWQFLSLPHLGGFILRFGVWALSLVASENSQSLFDSLGTQVTPPGIAPLILTKAFVFMEIHHWCYIRTRINWKLGDFHMLSDC